MTTSAEPGVVSTLASKNTLNESLENAVQEWLCEITGLESDAVTPTFEEVERILDKSNVLYFYFGEPTILGTEARQIDEEQQEVKFTKTITLHLIFYGKQARNLATKLCDDCEVNQSTFDLYKLGLGYVNAAITAILLEPLSKRYIKRVDVDIDFNYVYTKNYAINKINDVNIEVKHDT